MEQQKEIEPTRRRNERLYVLGDNLDRRAVVYQRERQHKPETAAFSRRHAAHIRDDAALRANPFANARARDTARSTVFRRRRRNSISGLGEATDFPLLPAIGCTSGDWRTFTRTLELM